jgi:oxygen-independent coproporphyrinogen III oxidase
MIEELNQRAKGECLSSVFFGGGTPSLILPDQLNRIMNAIRTLFDIAGKKTEVSLEANPGTIDEPYLAAIRQIGINRLSLGVQSLDDKTLVLLGRIHTADKARQAVRFARNSGFDNLSLDLIYGIPGQSLTDWQDTLKESVRLEPEHLSLYPLSLEDDVPLSGAIQNGELPAIDPDCTAEQYEAAEDYLAAEGYRHYEISNWAREDAECRHNTTYWQCEPYLGIGVAAHSYIDSHRQANTHDLDEYIRIYQLRELYQPEMVEEIAPETQLAEAIIMGLRLVKGIEFESMIDRFGIDVTDRYEREMDELIHWGLLESDGRSLRLTRRGRLLGNEVFWRFLPQ